MVDEEQSASQVHQSQEPHAASMAVSNIFDPVVAQNIEREPVSAPAGSSSGTSHPHIFRKGTLIEIPDVPPKPLQSRPSRRGKTAAPKQRLVAICIKNDDQAKYVIEWVLETELIPRRDNVVLIHVRQAANGIVGDLILTNNAKEVAERDRSHGILRRNAIPIKQGGYNIKGVSIRGVDIRGELVRKLVELKCDLVIIGNHTAKSMRERIIGCKVEYLTENSPCPVLVVGSRMQRVAKDITEDAISNDATDISADGTLPQVPILPPT
ncbi:hypothetical protein LPJ66_001962 [Kickxella alabastrina]|uniref:Uncharacterized protein n=1 Tax=Kickxella alabastrina TaxID=61397 RepID=A0ACC1IRW6_9FUNG|nr:hypothetical protein LPJ66_001962 [Kickxella alabastrina]